MGETPMTVITHPIQVVNQPAVSQCKDGSTKVSLQAKGKASGSWYLNAFDNVADAIQRMQISSGDWIDATCELTKYPRQIGDQMIMEPSLKIIYISKVYTE